MPATANSQTLWASHWTSWLDELLKEMDFKNILIGLLFLLSGLIGTTWTSRSAKEKKNGGLDYSTSKIIFSSWALIALGTILVILGILNGD